MEDPIELTPELLADFYAECEEQLANVRTQLVALEHAPSAADATVESIYRSIHSFKGNAAIVGLASAEQLAHAAEALLRRLTRHEAAWTPAVLDLLARAAQRLEATVEAFRTEQPLPPVADLVGEITPDSGAPAVGAVNATPITRPAGESASAETAGGPPGTEWRVTFRPTPELDARGINVTTVRARLASVGRITSAKPSIEGAGKVAFEFVVVTAEAPDLDAWAADGTDWQRSAPPAAETAPDNTLLNAPKHIVRVDLARLDELMRIVGEMVILRSRLQERIAQAVGDIAPFQEVNLGLIRSLRDLRAAIVRVRLVPVVEIFSRLPFVVRDLIRGTDKRVRIVIEGQDTEIDKYLVERLKEPLLHLVRNAVSHGIEAAADREARGKAGEATLRLTAEAAGDAVLIRVRDDGRGVDADDVVARARAAGLAVPETVDERAILRLICTPGFSTRDEADRAAGRGVGMAVVDTAIRDLGGMLSLHTMPGEFTEFTLRLPLTLSIADTFIVAAGDHRCAVPQGAVQEIVQMSVSDIRQLNEAEAGPFRGQLVPVVRLRRWFSLPAASAELLPVLVLNTERGLTGLLVDRIVGQREVVVRPVRDPLLRVPGVTGATELGDGRPVLILDPATLSEAAAAIPPARHGAGRPALSSLAP